MSISINDFLTLRTHLPVVDVRSEGEFAKGHMEGARNIPLLNDPERVIVGTTYKQRGQLAAIKAGFRLVGPRLESMIAEAEKAAKEKEMLVHCWRGGMRSENFCQFVNMAGIKTRSLAGGYKSYRTAALNSFRSPLPLVLLTGYTGSGKSEALRALADSGEQILDLEKLACHKGSVFGALFQPPQPTTEQFQNNLFEEIRKLDVSRRIWVEDESIAIGRIFLPTDFWHVMERSPIVQMDVTQTIRVQRLVEEYGAADREEFLFLMTKITRKLGGQNFQQAKESLLAGDMKSTIQTLLSYYDKAYALSMGRRTDRIKLTLPLSGMSMKEFAHELKSEMEKKLAPTVQHAHG